MRADIFRHELEYRFSIIIEPPYDFGIYLKFHARGFKKAFVATDPDLVKFGVSAKVTDLDTIREHFTTGIRTMRAFEEEIAIHSSYFTRNRAFVGHCVQDILGKLVQ